MSAPERAGEGQGDLLNVAGLAKHFGGVKAIDGLDFTIGTNEILGVVGPNGAGKSTLVGLIGGALQPSAGVIALDGRDITGTAANARARLGVGRTYQIPRPFLKMTVEENLLAAQFAVEPFASATLGRERCRAILERVGLADAAGQMASSLPLLRRKRLELARALALKPRLLMLDEVGAGLVDSEVSELIELIRSLASEIGAILIVEHIIRIVRECCSRVIVLNFGRLLVEGPTAQTLGHKQVAAVYLGASGEERGPGPSAASAEAEAAALFAKPTPEKVAAPVIELKGVSAGYGQARVLNGLDLAIPAGRVAAIVGANGAGKTTLAKVLNGSVKASSGAVRIAGQDVTRWPEHRIAALGVAHCMEGRRIFPGLSVEENLLLGARSAPSHEKRRRLDLVYGLFQVLHERRAVSGTLMSGGEQQMLAIGRALMSKPRAIVFDEISLGLAPVMIDRLYAALAAFRATGATMLIVEQEVQRALELADEAYVLERGVIALSGPPVAILKDPRLRQLYIGATDHPEAQT
jgi:ABC-type branched-subunit amino acid transport system ATPase component